MATSPPTRVDADVYAAAQHAAARMSRSTAQQISHWARIGREIEAAHTSAAAIGVVLDGAGRYDDLTVAEQAVVRAAWDERMASLRDGLDLRGPFAEARQAYVELDDDDHMVRRNPDGSTTLLHAG